MAINPHTAVVKRIDTSTPSLAEQVVEAVQASISSGRLVPGELYSVYQLATDLGVSRSPVREALLRLVETGIVGFERNRGFRIQAPGPREIAEIFSVRLALEVPAAKRAASKITEDQLHEIDALLKKLEAAAARDDEHEFMQSDQFLHGLILDVAGNKYAKQIIGNIRSATRLVGASTVNDRPLLEVYREHLPITDALRDHDPKRAAKAMEHHVKTTGRLLLKKAIAHASIPEGTEGDLWNELIT